MLPPRKTTPKKPSQNYRPTDQDRPARHVETPILSPLTPANQGHSGTPTEPYDLQKPYPHDFQYQK